MHKINKIILGVVLGVNAVYAGSVTVDVQTTGDNPKSIGTVIASETPYGILFTPHLTSLTPGSHGFHIHEHANCAHVGNDAGGHYDPQHTNSHKGPYANGHLGDLPVLYVNNEGSATTPILAPRLKLADLQGHALMIHVNSDNYTDNPPLGGGGARLACGVIK